MRKLLWKGTKSQTLVGILLGLGKGPSCWRDMTSLSSAHPPLAEAALTERRPSGEQ